MNERMVPMTEAEKRAMKARVLDDMKRRVELAEWRKVWADELARRMK